MPSGLTVTSLTCGSDYFALITVDGHVCYRNYRFKSPELISIEMDEQVLTVTSNKCRAQLYLKLKSGRVTVWNPSQVIRTSLTSVADACALYSKHPGTPTLTTLPTQCTSEQVMQSIVHFNNPATSDLQLEFDYKSIYLNTEIASQLSPYLAAQISGPWKAWIDELYAAILDFYIIPQYTLPYGISDYSFVAYFTYLWYVHCGTVGVVESQWVGELLELSVIAREASLRDHCLHLITTHFEEENGVTELVRSQHWPVVLTHLESSLTMDNAAYYLQLAEKTKNYKTKKKIRKWVSTESHSTARKVTTELLRLSLETINIQ